MHLVSTARTRALEAIEEAESISGYGIRRGGGDVKVSTAKKK